MGRRRQKKITIRNKENEVKGEDRISRLPDELIHRILSFNDAKDAVQTSLLSTRWRNIWKSLTHLNLDYWNFNTTADLSKFITEYLSHRDHRSDLSVFNSNFNVGLIQKSLLQEIIVYGSSHNLQQLELILGVYPLPPSLLTIQSLKQLSLTTPFPLSINLLKSTLVLPALTTLFLREVIFELSGEDDTNKSVDFFSNLPNLKNLTLFDCSINGVQVFNINSRLLEHLHIKFVELMRFRGEFIISAPKLSSFIYEGSNPLLMSANDLRCLDKVFLHFGRYDREYLHWKNGWKQGVCGEIVNMFHQLHNAKFVTVTLRTIAFLSWALEVLENQPCPFRNMECLKVEEHYWYKKLTFSTSVLTYLCNSSPGSTIINECSTYFPSP